MPHERGTRNIRFWIGPVLCLLLSAQGAFSNDASLSVAETDSRVTSVVLLNDTVYATTAWGLYRSDLKRENWSRVRLPKDVAVGGTLASVPVQSRALIYLSARNDKAGTISSELSLSTDQGVNWRRILSDRSIRFAKIIHSHLFVAVNDDELSGRLLASSDLGNSWEPVALPDIASRVDEIHPLDEGGIQIVGGNPWSYGDWNYHAHANLRNLWHSRYVYGFRLFGELDTDRVSFPSSSRFSPNRQYSLSQVIAWVQTRRLFLDQPAPHVQVPRGTPICVPVPNAWSREMNRPFIQRSGERLTICDSPVSLLDRIRVFDGSMRLMPSQEPVDLVRVPESRSTPPDLIDALQETGWLEQSRDIVSEGNTWVDLTQSYDLSQPGIYHVLLSRETDDLKRCLATSLRGITIPEITIEIVEGR